MTLHTEIVRLLRAGSGTDRVVKRRRKNIFICGPVRTLRTDRGKTIFRMTIRAIHGVTPRSAPRPPIPYKGSLISVRFLHNGMKRSIARVEFFCLIRHSQKHGRRLRKVAINVIR
jgi:hypothetical protein